MDERILELALALSRQGYSPDKITWFMNLLSSLKVDEAKPAKQEDLFLGRIPDFPRKSVPRLRQGEI